jgi:hypothetical protein
MLITFSFSLNVVCLNWKHYDFVPLMDIGKKISTRDRNLNIRPAFFRDVDRIVL